MPGPSYKTWQGRPFDREALVRDLRRAAVDADVLPDEQPTVATALAAGMARAFRVVAAAVEDGEYDHDPVTRLLEELRALVRRAKAPRRSGVGS
jgi:hypothetical protein